MSLISKLRTWREHVVYTNCFWNSEQFLYTACSPHVLQKEELLTKICIFNSPKKWTKNQIYSYGTSSRIIFVRFLGELKTPARHFEINWSLGHMRVHQFGSSWIDAFDNPSSLIMGYFTYKVLLFLRLGQKSLKNLLKTSKCSFEITWPL